MATIKSHVQDCMVVIDLILGAIEKRAIVAFHCWVHIQFELTTTQDGIWGFLEIDWF